MQKFEFVVEDSQGDEYEILFEREGNNLDVFCTCAAGENGIYCKHRFALMYGDVSRLLSDNDVAALKDFMKGTDVETTYNEVIELQAQYDELKTRLKATKKVLAKAMYH